MATLFGVLSAIEQAVIAATTGLTSSASDTLGAPLTVETGIGWPSNKTLQDNVRAAPNPTALISIYDRGMASDSTRWLPQTIGLAVTQATLTALTSVPVIDPHGTATITVGGPVTAGDAVAVVMAPALGQSSAQVISPAAAAAPSTVAASIAAAIQADPVLSLLTTATVSGAVVTLQSLTDHLIKLSANVGNGAIRTRELGRRNRDVQVILWTRTEEDRNTVADAVEAMIAGLEADFGITFPDATMGRVLYHGDRQFDDATMADTYRRDFFACVDYPITTTDALFAVLAPIARNTTF